MKQLVRPPARLEGTVRLPGDKSISQRAVLLNSIAAGTAHVSNYSAGEDGASMLRCLLDLGVEILPHSDCEVTRSDDCLEVRGRGPNGLSEPAEVLDAGNSGTTMRLLAGLLAAQPFFAVLSGDESLRSRPMTRVVQPLTLMGARISGRSGGSLAPLAILGGGLQGIEHIQPVASAQVKSSVLIAGLHAEGQTTVEQPDESRDHTERMVRSMGAAIETDGLRVSVRPSELSALNVTVPGDVSAAAFWLVAACCHPQARVCIPGVGINPTRTGVLDVLGRMGASVRLENVREEDAEPVADIVVQSSDLEATEIGGRDIPRVIDEIPGLALAACFAKGTTVISGAGELRVKESDRIRSTVEGLSRLGANVEERPDGMVVHGTGRLAGGEAQSHGDHRIAMAAGVAGLLAQGETVIDGAEAASVSYPGFWDTLTELARS